MIVDDRPLVWLAGEIRTPPFSKAGRREAGYLLRRVQRGDHLGPPHSRPMPIICARCHELRVLDEGVTWRIVLRVDLDAIVIVEVFAKKSEKTPKHVIKRCTSRLKRYNEALYEEE